MTIAATVTFAGFVYYSFVYVVSLEYSNTHRNVNAPHTHRYRGGNDNENRDGFEYVAGDPYWNRRDDLFVRGEDKLRKSLKRQTETGGPLLVVLEDQSASSKRLRDHIWSDGIVQNLLRGGRGGDTSRRALRFPPIAVRVYLDKDDGAFLAKLVASVRVVFSNINARKKARL